MVLRLQICEKGYVFKLKKQQLEQGRSDLFRALFFVSQEISLEFLQYKNRSERMRANAEKENKI